VILAAGLPDAQLAVEDTTPDLGPELHVGEHSCLPLSGHGCAPSLAGQRSGALHFLVVTALHFLIGIYTGCRAEHSRLRTAERLTNLLAVFCIIGWRVFWLTMTNRVSPDATAEVALTSTEIEILDRVAGATLPAGERTVSHYLAAVARLGGYLARAGDPPPGNMVIWRGLTRLTDIPGQSHHFSKLETANLAVIGGSNWLRVHRNPAFQAWKSDAIALTDIRLGFELHGRVVGN
jgi:hypothetical protein